MVEAEISLFATDVFKNGVAETCAELEIMVAHTALGAGMLTGQIKSLDDMPANDYHQFFPRFQPEELRYELAAGGEDQGDSRARGARLLSWRCLGSRFKVVYLICRSLYRLLAQGLKGEYRRMPWMSTCQIVISLLSNRFWIASLLRDIDILQQLPVSLNTRASIT